MIKKLLNRKLILACASVLTLPIYNHAASRYYSTAAAKKDLDGLKLISCSGGDSYFNANYINTENKALGLDGVQISYPSPSVLKAQQIHVLAGGKVIDTPEPLYQDGVVEMVPNFAQETLSPNGVLSITVVAAWPAFNIPSDLCDHLTLSRGKASTGNISIHNKTLKPVGASGNPNVEIDKKDGSKLGDYIVPWGENFGVNNIVPGEYTIKAPVYIVDNSHVYAANVSPAILTVLKGETVEADVSYSLLALDGKITLQAHKPQALQGYSENPVVTLTDTDTKSLLTTKTVRWDEVASIDGLMAGDHYTLSSSNIVYNQNLCSASFSPASITASKSGSSVSLTYQCQPIPTALAEVMVNGAPKTQSSVNVHFTPEDTARYKSITQAVKLVDGKGSAKTGASFAVGQTYNISVDGIAGYTPDINPAKIKVTKDGFKEQITYAKASDQVRVGYLPQSSVGPKANMNVKISDAVKMGYNMIIVAFGEDKATADMQYTFNVFQAYNGWNPIDDKVRQTILDDIKSAKGNGLKHVLISVGGSANTFTLASSQTELQEQAGKIWTFLEANGYDGIDFDLESTFNGDNLHTLIGYLKSDAQKAGKSIIITAAPQLNMVGDGSAALVSTAVSQDYDAAIKAGDFDYLIIQEGFTAGYTINGTSEKDPEFGINSYLYLTHQLKLSTGNQNEAPVTKPFAYTIPANTKLLIDPLAGPNSVAPATNTIWHVCDAESLQCPDDLWSKLKASYTQLKTESQFGGPAVWDISHDAYNQCAFSMNISPIFGISQGDIVCPKI
ncbi:glycosyl hydrolase family 18 protein [Cysteiniphilum sp. JM-1]|uniref:glycosyl hydrolase family 18 protein n=1 Tax=Cysteiniphilum sp. JM-1 TaxID=2610891 RepID=UPI001246B96F|nr:glycosyl hydrolase family 18 protein [Cysteiniphilum sp. JM-1]